MLQLADLVADPRNAGAVRSGVTAAMAHELVARLDLESLSAVTLDGLFRLLASGNADEMPDLEPRPTDEDERELFDHAEICRRLRYLHALDTDEKRAAEMAKCERDPLHYIAHWVWMLDPRPQMAPVDDMDWDDETALFDAASITQDLGRARLMVRPIVLWQRQRELVRWFFWLLARLLSGLGKKSRDVGFSVICCAIGVWFWLFRQGSSVGFGSRKEALVDTIGNMDALFPKMRFILARLPHWMMPSGFNWRVHSKEMLLINPANGTIIKGEGGKNLGNAGRSTIFFMDEFSLVEHQKAVHEGLSANSNTVIYFGRSAGPMTYFYELEARNVYPVFRFPWYHDPRKVDDPLLVGEASAPSTWADAMRATLGPAPFAELYGCDDDEAEANVVVPVTWVQAAVDIVLSPCAVDRVAGIDVADGGADESVLCVRQGPHVQWWTWANMEAKTLAVPTASICEREGVRYVYFDAQGVGGDFGGKFIAHAQGAGYSALGFHGQLPASKYRTLDDFQHDGRTVQTCRVRFENQLTEQWWAMRLRFRRTFELLEWQRAGSVGEPPHDPADCISIADDPILRRQLKRSWHRTAKGKIMLQDKKQLTSSPDRADALALTECVALQIAEDLPPAKRSAALKSRFHNARF